MRLERMDLRDRDGNREWRLSNLDAPVVLWWDSSRSRIDQFGDWAGALGSLSSHHSPLIDDARVIESRAMTVSAAGRRAVTWRSGRSGWWFEDAPTQRCDQTSGELWRLDHPDTVHDFWARYAANSAEQSIDELWRASSVMDERGEFHSRADYESWLEEASALRRKLNELLEQRDRLRSRWEAERHADRERIGELRAELSRVEAELTAILDRIRSLRDQAVAVERREVALRAELRDLPEFIEVRREVKRAAPVVDLSALEAIDRRMLSWRRAHQRIDRAIEQMRGELTAINLAGDARSEASFQRIRRGLFDFEAAAEQILRVSHRMELQWPAGSERRLPAEGEMKATCESLYDELHRLYESLNQRHATLARKNITLRLRHLRRLQRDLSRHLKALLARREKLVEQLGRSGVPADRLGVRAQQGFCRCAREDGYSGSCDSWNASTAGRESTTACQYETVRTSNRQRRDELVEALRLAADELRQTRARIDAEEPRRRELEARRKELEQKLRALETADGPTDYTRALESLRAEIDAGERRLEYLLDLIGRYERGTILRHHAGLERAGNWVARISRGRWNAVALSVGDPADLDGDGDRECSLLVRSGDDQWVAWDTLTFDDRRVVALGLALAWNAQRSQRTLWPTVLSQPWVGQRDLACELVRESAAAQVARSGSSVNWKLAPSSPTRCRCKGIANVDAASHCRSRSSSRASASPPMTERRVLEHRVNNSDAEEFPGP
ncbi:MAG: hypothetical protein R3B96_16485 [Pirellulaceae bacterium]